jgi:hypothetical protein
LKDKKDSEKERRMAVVVVVFTTVEKNKIQKLNS